MSMQPGYGNVKGTTGAVSVSPVRGTLTQTVTKPPVLKGLLKNAIKGGATFGKITPAGIARAVVAEAAFSLVAEKLEEHQFKWSDEHQNFVNDKEYTVECRNIATPSEIANDKSKNYGYVPCGGISAYVRNMPDVVNAVMTSVCQSQNDPKHNFEYYVGDFANGTCRGTRTSGEEGIFWYIGVRTVLNSSRAITQSEFDTIIGPIMDNSPSPYINASADESGKIPGISEPKILIIDGTIAQSAPYTNPETGQAEQASWRFNTSGAGDAAETTVTETIIPRPDLAPYSQEAPVVSTPAETQTETETEQQPASAPGICDEYPDILACDKQPEAPTASAPLEIPTETVNLQFQPDSVFPNAGTCPPPVSFNVFDSQYAFDTQPICDMAVMLRPLIITIAWLVAAFFIVSTVKSEM